MPDVGEGLTGEPGTHQERLTVAQAATALGITEGAVRSRIKRGTLSTVHEGGRVFVLLGVGSPATHQATDHTEDLIRTLREQLEAEREANRENRRIIAGLTQRIPAIEASSEPRGSPESPGPRDAPTDAGEGPTSARERPFAEDEREPRSWWRRVFGG